MGDIEPAGLGTWERVGDLAQFGAVVPTLIVSQVLESAGFGWWILEVQTDQGAMQIAATQAALDLVAARAAA